MVNCGHCGTQTKNNKYCTRTCAATVNNLKPKRVKKLFSCITCSLEISRRRKYCNTCDPRTKGDITLGEAIYRKHHRSSAYALVRSRARSVVKDEKAKCEVCSYNKHVEVAHIKAIAEFSEETLLSVINDRSNLRLLCPNCHWELDNL